MTLDYIIGAYEKFLGFLATYRSKLAGPCFPLDESSMQACLINAYNDISTPVTNYTAYTIVVHSVHL